ncbi:MAG: hypothetical protein Ct9H300mP24_3590 [Candidatus Neomarinimicrobiota bacterium]|nr:MAG: hypothetical protein Ct9H300mP24_3590 [Candidatus Neomarinimicrobiota bacterium]
MEGKLKDATSKIRGEKGTDVILTIKKPITEEVHDYTINRDIISSKIFHTMGWLIQRSDTSE